MVRFSIIIQKWYCVEAFVTALSDTIKPKLTKKCNETETDIMQQHYQQDFFINILVTSFLSSDKVTVYAIL